ncbi:Protein kinase domain containing protein [Musa troglodytarum]|uniref:Protein kinase domain containing protein n=1 Tax=Musa troglodytarum TaxID=320322 RepID=A0A9E7HCH2_9LILI|nr:Protein kinase domain containing protein [Musa troglodytarum]URE27603.1 Protein kinase domain containing protein [Musa troglodytarum]
MDARKGVGSASQRPKQYPPNSTDANVRPSEVSVSSVARPVLNYSIQTGEEFALEFMRERAMSKKPAVQNAPEDQSITTSYMDMKGVLSIPHMGSESASDLSVLVTRDNHHLKETEKNNFFETEHKGHYASSRSMPRVSSGEGSNQTVPHGYTSSEASDMSSKRLKFLCSFGGKILPRPSDGKLRYVGGDTRIIRVSRNISWEELMQKTMAIYGRPHTVKYQLPGEDLDALISVSCDEDLQNMMEEYSIVEGGEGSQKLRMFLFTSDDSDDVHFSFGSMEGDSDIQYVVAVNGMDLGSGKASYGHGLPSTSTSDLDQLLNLNIEPERANAYTIVTQSAGFAADPVASPATLTAALQASSSTDYGSYSQGFEDHRCHYVEGEHYAYSPIYPPDRHPYSNSRISIPLPAPSDYQYSSNYTATSTSTQPGQQTLYQGVPQVPHSGISPFDKETAKKDAKVAVDGSSQRKTENEHTGSHKNEPTSTIQQHDITVSSYMHAESMGIVAAPENSMSLPPSKSKGKQPEPGLVSSTNAANVTHGSDLSEHDQYSSSGALMSGSIDDEADVTDVSYSNPPSRPSRGYQSERLPREQAELLNRLSKSDDSIGSQYLINQACLIAAQESIPEVTDTILEGDLGSQADKFLSSAKPPRPSNAAAEDKYKKVRNSITQANKFEPVSTAQGSESAKFSQHLIPLTNHNMHDPNEGAVSSVVQAGLGQIDALTDEKSYKQGGKIQKTESQHAPLKSAYDKPTITEGMEKVTTVAETDMLIKNEDLEELRELGSGTFGTVYHGKWRGTDVAIKRIKKSCFSGRSSEQERLTMEFWREAEILSQLHHPNVVAFYGVVKDGPGGTMATVAEFMVNGSLRHVLLCKDKYLDRRKKLIIAMDAAFGMEYLHSKNIVHFDLKCDNLLVNLKDQSRPICKVGDFGLSKIKRNTLVSGGVRGTLPWMAPELLNGSSNKVSEKVDVFSFGIVMWEILTGEEPYANMHYGAIIGGIVNNTLRPPVPATCDPEWRKLMEQCWAPDPVQRPSFTQIAGCLRGMSVASQVKPGK